MITDRKTLTDYLGYKDSDLKFYEILSDINNYDIDTGVEIVYQYYRKHGFPYYQIREDEKHQH